LHCHTAAVDAPYLGGDDASPSPIGVPHLPGGRRDVIRKPAQVAGEFAAVSEEMVGRRPYRRQQAYALGELAHTAGDVGVIHGGLW